MIIMTRGTVARVPSKGAQETQDKYFSPGIVPNNCPTTFPKIHIKASYEKKRKCNNNHDAWDDVEKLCVPSETVPLILMGHSYVCLYRTTQQAAWEAIIQCQSFELSLSLHLKSFVALRFQKIQMVFDQSLFQQLILDL